MRYSQEVAEELERNVIMVRNEIRHTLGSLLGEVAPLLKTERAREFLQYGVARRLRIIQRCISNICGIFPVQRTELLDEDELGDVGINLHAFLINTHGVPDNLTWVYLLERAIHLEPRHIGLFNRRTESYLPKEVLAHVKSERMTKWHTEYAKNYRDALAHRVPPYVPPYVLTREHRVRYEKLEEETIVATKAGDVDRALALAEEQATCGDVCLTFAQTFSDDQACNPVYLHAQLIADTRTVLKLITVMHPHLNS